MTRDEEGLLLYLESCLVDRMGRVDPRRLNEDDVMTIGRWMKAGFVDMRLLLGEEWRVNQSHRVIFCNEAWQAAANARRRRAEQFSRTWSRDVLAGLGHSFEPFAVGDAVPID